MQKNMINMKNMCWRIISMSPPKISLKKLGFLTNKFWFLSTDLTKIPKTSRSVRTAGMGAWEFNCSRSMPNFKNPEQGIRYINRLDDHLDLYMKNGRKPTCPADPETEKTERHSEWETSRPKRKRLPSSQQSSVESYPESAESEDSLKIHIFSGSPEFSDIFKKKIKTTEFPASNYDSQKSIRKCQAVFFQRRFGAAFSNQINNKFTFFLTAKCRRIGTVPIFFF